MHITSTHRRLQKYSAVELPVLLRIRRVSSSNCFQATCYSVLEFIGVISEGMNIDMATEAKVF
jgi:hypothetical protein